MKWYQVIFTFLIGVGIGMLLSSYWPEPDHGDIEDPLIHKYKEEIGWRDFREAKTQDTIKILKKEKLALSNDVIKERQRADRSESKLKEHRKQAIPPTTKDTISFLIEDDTLCSEALADSKELAAALTIEVMTDEAIIKGQGELIDSLQSDKKDLLKVDSLNQIDKKKLRKANRKKFFRGMGIGGVVGVIVAVIL